MVLNDLIQIKERELASRKKYVLRCCMAAGCMSSNAQSLKDELEKAVAAAGLKDEVEVRGVGCLKLCCLKRSSCCLVQCSPRFVEGNPVRQTCRVPVGTKTYPWPDNTDCWVHHFLVVQRDEDARRTPLDYEGGRCNPAIPRRKP